MRKFGYYLIAPTVKPAMKRSKKRVYKIVAQLPPVIESLTGIKFEKLLEQVPALRKAAEKGEDKQK